MLIRERGPTRLSVNVDTPDGHQGRWAEDAHHPENAIQALSFSTTAPGGDEQLSGTLQRQPDRTYPDLAELSRITVRGAGGTIAWGGRLEQTPDQSGDQITVSPQAVGYVAALDDDSSAREDYIDADMSAWQSASVQRKLNQLAASIDTDDPAVSADPTTGAPSVATQLSDTWTRTHQAEAWYDARAIPISQLFYSWKIGAAVSPADTNWSWLADLSSDDLLTASDETAELRGAGPGSGSLSASATNRVFARLRLKYAGAGGTGGLNFPVYWQAAVVGAHGCPLQTAATFPGAPGVLASDVVAHAVGRWAPGVSYSTGEQGTIRPSTFVIPHLVFKTAGTASAIVKQAASLDLQDWGVRLTAGGPMFYFAPWGTFGRCWRARTSPAKLQDAGPQIDRIWNGVIVQYTDVSGVARTVGPPGSRCDVEDQSLRDLDPFNPANEAGVRRWTALQIGTNATAAAIRIGRTFLAEQKLLASSGQAALVGHVEDDRGVWWPAWMVRAGDAISFVDARDTSARRIVRTDYAHDSRTCTVQLDQPPDGLQALLARIGATLAPLGFS